MDNRYGLGLVGSIALVMGVFSPLISLPVVGNLNYFENGQGDAVVVLLVAVIALIATFRREYKYIGYLGVAALIVIAFTFVNVQLKMSAAREEMTSSLSGNPFDGLAEAMAGTIQLQWGWAVLGSGAILLAAAGASQKRAAPDQPARKN